MRLTVLTMPCDAPAPVLAALLAVPHVEIAPVVLASADGRVGASAVERTANEAGLRVVPARTIAEADAAIEDAAPDLAVAACFPWRVPARVRALPRLGVLNVHPSPLPRGRGPEPVFWTLRNGERETGVTVHVMDGGLDTGPVLAQERLAVPPGVRAPELERELMALGGRLLAELLPRLASGEAEPVPEA